MLNEILDSAVDAFVETLTVTDIQVEQPITTSIDNEQFWAEIWEKKEET